MILPEKPYFTFVGEKCCSDPWRNHLLFCFVLFFLQQVGTSLIESSKSLLLPHCGILNIQLGTCIYLKILSLGNDLRRFASLIS